jgi:dienelactone hydrolase
MKKLNFYLLLLFTITASFAFIFNSSDPATSIKAKSDVKCSGRADNIQEPELFILQPQHPAYRLDGCILKSCAGGSLSFEFRKSGHSVVVLKASAPLIITKQTGMAARLRPGWDGTLGYSLYALEIEAGEKGSGMVSLMAQPVPAGLIESRSEFDARTSRFPGNPEGFLRWQHEWRDKLAHRLMNGGLPSRVPLDAKVVETVDHPSFTLRRVVYQTQSDRSNTLLLSLPKNMTGKVPLLIALHGHESTWGEADSAAFRKGHIDDFCAYFAERGWAVVQPATMNHTLHHPGWTLQGEWTWDAMVALDYATSLPEVDTKHVSVCGLSTGAHLAMNLLALDDRVRSGVAGCILSSWHHYRERMRIPPHCDCGILGQLGDFLEQCDWAALAAPKPVQFQHGRQDASFCPGADPALLNAGWNTSVMPEKEFATVFDEVKTAYQLTGEPGNVDLYIHDDGHRVNNEAAWKFLTGNI